MPLYDYKCEKCGEQFEQLLSASNKNAAVKCPKCNSTKTTRQFSSFTGTCSAGAGTGAAACPTGTCPFTSN